MGTLNTKIFDARAVTGANVYVSLPVDLSLLSILGIEIQMTGTPNGTFAWEASNQYDPLTNPNATFVAGGTPSPALPVPAGAPVSYVGSLTITAGAGACRWVRLRYTNTSGTGVLDIWATGRNF